MSLWEKIKTAPRYSPGGLVVENKVNVDGDSDASAYIESALEAGLSQEFSGIKAEAAELPHLSAKSPYKPVEDVYRQRLTADRESLERQRELLADEIGTRTRRLAEVNLTIDALSAAINTIDDSKSDDEPALS